MAVLKVIWFLVKWWFLIGAVSAAIYIFVRYLRGQLKDSDTWMFAILLLVAWPPVIYVGAATSWQDRHKIKDEVFSPESRKQLGEHKTLACIAGVATLVGLWMLLSPSGQSGPPKPENESLICASCQYSFEVKASVVANKNSPVNCTQCGKKTAWVKACCPFCRTVFPYGQLVEQGADQSLWKCPKCGKMLPNTKK